MKKIIITNESTITAEGVHSNGNCKLVMCKTTGQIWTSATDAGKANAVTEGTISLCCTGKQKGTNGKTFCYVEDMPEHYEDIARIIRMMYPDWLAAEERRAEERRLEEERQREEKRLAAERRREEKRLAEEQRKEEQRIAKAKANYAKACAQYNKARDGFEKAKEELYALNAMVI